MSGIPQQYAIAVADDGGSDGDDASVYGEVVSDADPQTTTNRSADAGEEADMNHPISDPEADIAMMTESLKRCMPGVQSMLNTTEVLADSVAQACTNVSIMTRDMERAQAGFQKMQRLLQQQRIMRLPDGILPDGIPTPPPSSICAPTRASGSPQPHNPLHSAAQLAMVQRDIMGTLAISARVSHVRDFIDDINALSEAELHRRRQRVQR